MRIAIIVGANNVSVSVAKLLSDRYEVVIVDKSDEACARAFKALKSSAMVYKGDPSSVDVLNEVGIDKAELFLALSDDDDLNYKACSIAKEKGVPIIIARVNNKDHEDLFKELNITSTVNVEDIVSNNIRNAILSDTTKVLFTDPTTNISFAIIKIGGDSSIVGKQINYLIDNYNVAIPYIITSNGIIKPGNDYVIEGDNEIVVVGPSESIDKFIKEVSSTE